MKHKRAWVEPNPKHPRGARGRFVKRGTGTAAKVAAMAEAAAPKRRSLDAVKVAGPTTLPKKKAPKSVPAPASAHPVNPATGATVRPIASGGPFRTITPAEAETMQRQMLSREPWTAKQRADLRRYTGDDYAGINGVARTGKGSAADRATVPVMRSAMREIPEDISLTRSVRADAFGLRGLNGGNELSDREVAQLTPGRTFHEPGFSSASVGTRGNGLRLQISVPKGTRGAYVDSISQNRGETELILDVGTHYRIDRVERHLLKGTIIHVTVVGQDA